MESPIRLKLPEIVVREDFETHARIYAMRVPIRWLIRVKYPRLQLAYWLVRLVFSRRAYMGL